MKTILNPAGGRPVKNEDLELFGQFITLFERVFENINAIGDFIISGCVISGSDVSAGFIYYDGKICTFDGDTGVSFPLAMERLTVAGTPRTFFDSVVKNSVTTETIIAQVGGGFSLSASTPRFEDYFIRLATIAEEQAGTNTSAAITPATLLDAFRVSSNHAASETNRGTARIADETTARAGSNNTEIMTTLRVLDAIRNGTAFLAQTTYPGVVEKATTTERDAGTANKYIDAALLDGFNGGLKTKIVDIGSWDMDATASISVAHGLSYSNIRGIKVLIKDDDGTLWTPLDIYSGGSSGGNYVMTATQVQLSREAGGLFDSTDFNSGLGSRGYILIDHI